MPQARDWSGGPAHFTFIMRYAIFPATYLRETAMGTLMFWFVVTAVLALYFLPWLVALGRKHAETVPIFILNFFLGWSLIGWVVALAWAFTSNVKPPKIKKIDG